ncbi:MAG: hypothetical protein NDI88_02010 [Lysobacter sp.]|nr:hypothetical protein [Lysobacter sp.]
MTDGRAMDEMLRRATMVARGIWSHRRLGLATAWAVGAIALAALSLLPEKYEASARIFANTDSILKPLMTGLTVQPNDDQRIVMLSRVVISRPNVERLVQAVGLDADAETPEARERVIDSVIRTLHFKGAGRDNLYTLTFRDVDPRRAKQAIDMLAAMFIESSRGGKESDSDAARKFIDEQIAVYEKKLQEAETRLKEFRLRYLVMSPSDGRDFFVRMSDAQAQLVKAQLELSEAQRARDAYRARLESEERAQDGGSPGAPDAASQLAEVESRIDSMRRSLDQMLQRYTEEHPDVVGARRVIRDLEEQRRQLTVARRKDGGASGTVPGGARASEQLKVSLAQAEAAVASLTIRVAEYTARYERLKASAALVPQLEAEHAQLNRDYDVNKRNYESLVGRRESAKISSEMQSVAGVSDFRLVDPPRVSPHPVSPNRRILIPLALLLSLMAGLAAAYVAAESRPIVYDGRDLRELSGLPLLGVVTLMPSPARDREERRSLLRFAGSVTGLVVAFAACFVVLELLTVRVV